MFPPLFFSVRLPTVLALLWRTYIQPDSSVGILHKEPVSIIIFRLDSMGDVVLTTPLFREIKKAYPRSRSTVVVKEAYRALLVTNPHIDEVLSLPETRPTWLPQGIKRLLSAVRLYWTRLRGRTFDFAISPRWDVDEHLATFLCVLSNASSRVGYSERVSPAKQLINRGFDAAFSNCLPPATARHEVLHNLGIVEALGGTVSDDRLEIRLTEPDRRRASKLLAQVTPSSKLIAIGIGAHSPGRRWPLHRYAETLLQLANKYPVHTAVVCSAAEREDAAKLANLLPGHTLIVSGAPIREVCAVLERCDLFVGNDSGCAHLAAAVNCKTIVISRHPRDGDPKHFNSPVRFAPHGNFVRVLQPATGRDGCKAACYSLEPHCVTSVAVETVVATARKMLEDSSPTLVPLVTTSLPENFSRHLLHSHSAVAMQRAVEALRSAQNRPPAPVR
jgi:heptosyltransferase-2